MECPTLRHQIRIQCCCYMPSPVSYLRRAKTSSERNNCTDATHNHLPCAHNHVAMILARLDPLPTLIYLHRRNFRARTISTSVPLQVGASSSSKLRLSCGCFFANAVRYSNQVRLNFFLEMCLSAETIARLRIWLY